MSAEGDSGGGRTFVLVHGAWRGGVTQGLRLTGARERVPKKAYVLATGWANAAFPVFAEKVKDDPDWRYYEVACGHDVMLDESERLAQILQEAA